MKTAPDERAVSRTEDRIGFWHTAAFVAAFASALSSHAAGLKELYSFESPPSPSGTLVQSADGFFYGTSMQGGSSGRGFVFRAATNGELTVFASFSLADGSRLLNGGVVIGSDGALYGTTYYGGNANGVWTDCELRPERLRNTVSRDNEW